MTVRVVTAASVFDGHDVRCLPPAEVRPTGCSISDS
jgi:hypothetical protein